MVNWAALGAVSLIYAAGVVIPGPNFVAVAHKAVAATKAQALMLVAGIVVVNLFWAACAILGIGVVFAAFPWLALVIKVAGAGYLIWFGSRLIIASGQQAVSTPQVNASGLRQAFFQGVITNIGNPKAIAFFAAIFSAATPPHLDVATFIAMLGVVGVMATVWYGFVALTLSHPRIAAAYRRRKKWIDRVCGALIVGLGVRMAVRS